MSLQDDLDSKAPGEWTDDDVHDLQRKYSRIHFDHFQGVMDNPTHPKDDPNWVRVGVGRWKRIHAGDMPEVTQ